MVNCERQIPQREPTEQSMDPNSTSTVDHSVPRLTDTASICSSRRANYADIPSWTLCREPVRSVVRRVQGCRFQMPDFQMKALSQKLTASVFAADRKSRKDGSREDPV